MRNLPIHVLKEAHDHRLDHHRQAYCRPTRPQSIKQKCCRGTFMKFTATSSHPSHERRAAFSLELANESLHVAVSAAQESCAPSASQAPSYIHSSPSPADGNPRWVAGVAHYQREAARCSRAGVQRLARPSRTSPSSGGGELDRATHEPTWSERPPPPHTRPTWRPCRSENRPRSGTPGQLDLDQLEEGVVHAALSVPGCGRGGCSINQWSNFRILFQHQNEDSVNRDLEANHR